MLKMLNIEQGNRTLMSIEEKIAEIEGRLSEAGSTASAVCREAGVARSTWQRWKCGAVSPNIATWQMVEDAVERICVAAKGRDAA